MTFVKFGSTWLVATIVILAQPGKEMNPVLLRAPGRSWGVQIDTPGFVPSSGPSVMNGRPYLLATNQASGVTVSITLERVSAAATVQGCKDSFRGRIDQAAALQASQVKTSQVGE